MNTKLLIAQSGGDKKAAEEIEAQIAAKTQEITARFKDTAASMRPGAPAPTVTPTAAASNAGAQFTWDPKQNKLVPVGQPQQ